MESVKLYDTTLRDGTQAEDISFTVEDKIRISRKLDDLGIDYVEGGWPGSNPRDELFFSEIKKHPLSKTIMVAFGSTARPGVLPEKDKNIRALLRAKTHAVAIVGKAWDVHVREALGISLEENLRIIFSTIAFLKQHVPEVIFDAEHFWDGFKHNPDYALQVIQAAGDAACDWVVLCDTNGGTMPFEIQTILQAVRARFPIPMGIHCHNDS
jgi:2-isopropylmalate synthase